MILRVLSSRVVMVIHGILNSVKNSEGIRKGSKGDNVPKPLHKGGSLHEEKA
jgi:hypothetical protein